MASYQPHPGSPWVAEAVARVMAFDRTAIPIEPLPAPSGATTWADVLDAMAMHRVVEVVFPTPRHWVWMVIRWPSCTACAISWWQPG